MEVNPIKKKLCLATSPKYVFEEIIYVQKASCFILRLSSPSRERTSGSNGARAALLPEPVSMGTIVIYCQPGCNTTVHLLGALQLCTETDLTGNDRLLQHWHEEALQLLSDVLNK